MKLTETSVERRKGFQFHSSTMVFLFLVKLKLEESIDREKFMSYYINS